LGRWKRNCWSWSQETWRLGLIPAQISDPEAKQPEDWDAELDGEWEVPLIPNPEYKGEWKAPRIPNPAYKGEWVHPRIPNPEYKEDNQIYAFNSNKFIGIEIWQVKSGTIFDNFLVTDNVETAAEWAEKSANRNQAEKDLKKKQDDEKRAATKDNEAAPGTEEEPEITDLDLDDDDDTETKPDHDEL